MRTALLIILIILAVALAAVAYGGQAINGAWAAEIDGDEIHISLVLARDSKPNGVNMIGVTISLASVGSITATRPSSRSADVNFAIDGSRGGCEVARWRSYAVGWAGPRNRVTPP